MVVPCRRLGVSIPSPPLSPRPYESRAPPPSPSDEVASIGGCAGPQFEAFLRHAAVPSLVLSGAMYKRRMHTVHAVAEETPPVIDMVELKSLSCGSGHCAAAAVIKEAARDIGCFQLVNHGVSTSISREAAVIAAAAVSDPGCSVMDQNEVDDLHDDDEAEREDFEAEREDDEDDVVFRWSRDTELVPKMVAGTCSREYEEKLRANVDALWSELERVAREVIQVLEQEPKPATEHLMIHDDADYSSESPSPSSATSSTLCFHEPRQRNCRATTGTAAVPDLNSNSASSSSPLSLLHHDDAIRMLVHGERRRRKSVSRGGWRRHSLYLYLICDRASGFQIYSKKRGWSTFRPAEEAIVVAVGDQLQVSSEGLYPQTIGKPIFHFSATDAPACPSSCIWASFEYYHPLRGSVVEKVEASCERTISLLDQLMIAGCLVLLYHLVAAWLW